MLIVRQVEFAVVIVCVNDEFDNSNTTNRYKCFVRRKKVDKTITYRRGLATGL